MALKPRTEFAPYEELLPELDMVLVMTVEPGFGGQSFMADQMPKVAQVREAVRRHGGEIWVQVDGGVSASTIEQCAEAGADVFVAGLGRLRRRGRRRSSRRAPRAGGAPALRERTRSAATARPRAVAGTAVRTVTRRRRATEMGQVHTDSTCSGVGVIPNRR